MILKLLDDIAIFINHYPNLYKNVTLLIGMSMGMICMSTFKEDKITLAKFVKFKLNLRFGASVLIAYTIYNILDKTPFTKFLSITDPLVTGIIFGLFAENIAIILTDKQNQKNLIKKLLSALGRYLTSKFDVTDMDVDNNENKE